MVARVLTAWWGLLWCWAITGTLDPVRGLTGLTTLFVASNVIGGMSVRAAVAYWSMIRWTLWCWCVNCSVVGQILVRVF